jgi:hypothetical protein
MTICVIPFGIPVLLVDIRVIKITDREEDRGLILYLDNKLEATEIHMETNFQENLFVKKKLNQIDKLLVGLVYKSPFNRTSE